MSSIREDGRSASSSRPCALARAPAAAAAAARSDGGARWRRGRTLLSAGAHGPRAPLRGRDTPPSGEAECALEVTWAPARGVAGAEARRNADRCKAALRAACGAHLRSPALRCTGVVLAVQEVSDDGGALAAGLNAASAALADAGVPMEGLMAAATRAIQVGGGGGSWADPTAEEEAAPGVATLTVATLPAECAPREGADVVMVDLQWHGGGAPRGGVPADALAAALEEARGDCEATRRDMAQQLRASQLWSERPQAALSDAADGAAPEPMAVV